MDRETISYLRATGSKSGKGSEMDDTSTPGYQVSLHLAQKVELMPGGFSRGTRESQRVAKTQTRLWAKSTGAQVQLVQSPVPAHQGVLLQLGKRTKDGSNCTWSSRNLLQGLAVCLNCGFSRAGAVCEASPYWFHSEIIL